MRGDEHILHEKLNRNWSIYKRGKEFVAIDNRDQIVEPIVDGNTFYIESFPSWKKCPNYIFEKVLRLNKRAGFEYAFDD